MYAHVRQQVAALQWKFNAVPSTAEENFRNLLRSMYAGPEELRKGIQSTFEDPMEALIVVGGLTYEFVASITACSNNYFEESIKGGERPTVVILD